MAQYRLFLGQVAAATNVVVSWAQASATDAPASGSGVGSSSGVGAAAGVGAAIISGVAAAAGSPDKIRNVFSRNLTILPVDNHRGITSVTVVDSHNLDATAAGSDLRLTVKLFGDFGNTVEVYAGQAASSGDAHDFANTPAHVTFAGGDIATNNTVQRLTSDWVTLPETFDGTKNFSVAVNWIGTTVVNPYQSGSEAVNNKVYGGAGAEAAMADKPFGYTFFETNAFVDTIETRVAWGAVGASFAASAAAAVGTGAAAATASGITVAAGASAGTGTALATGAATSSGVGAAAGTGTANGSSDATAVNSGAGAAAGTGTAAAVGFSFFAAVGQSSGIGAGGATGFALFGASATAAGSGAASATGRTTAASTASATGAGSANAVASVGGNAAGSAAGTGAAQASGTALKEATGAASGIGAAAAVGSATFSAVAAAQGDGAALAVATSTAEGVGNAAGIGEAAAVGGLLGTAIRICDLAFVMTASSCVTTFAGSTIDTTITQTSIETEMGCS